MNWHDIPSSLASPHLDWMQREILDLFSKLEIEDRVQLLGIMTGLRDTDSDDDIFLEHKEAVVPSPPDFDGGFSRLLVFLRQDHHQDSFWTGVSIESTNDVTTFTGPMEPKDDARERFEGLEELVQLHTGGPFPTVEAFSEELEQVGIHNRRNVRNDV